uniref:Heparanase n=1 Tax=Anopheles christyi TaxID=43041 RepID=A0A182JU12_9DIPT
MTVVQSKVQLFTRLWLVVVILLLVPGVRGVNGNNEVPEPESVRQLSVSVNTRRLANVLGDEFISFSSKPQDIFDGQGNPITETSFLMAQSLGGTLLKVIADSSQLHLQTTSGQSVIGNPDDIELVQISASAWQAFYDWARRATIVPVFVLDYPTDGGQWDVKKALRILTAANALDIDVCRWQLGNGLVKDGVKYADDLRTFRTMLQAFPKQHWTIVASELNPQFVPLEDIQYFHANADNLVEAITMTRPRYDSAVWNYTSLQRDIHLRGLSKQRLPIWLDLVAEQQRTDLEASAEARTSSNSPTCCKTCIQEGLDYARTLGEAARGGISAVFQPLQRDDIQQYSLNYLVALLYKQTVGHKVFPVSFNVVPPTEETRLTSVYAYCTRNRTGSLTLVVVNGAQDGATNATIKLMTRSLSSPVELFLLSVQDGQPMVNNLPMEYTTTTTLPLLQPVKAVTTLTNGVSFYVPSQSILFAVVPGVQLRECRSNTLPERKKFPRELQHDRTSTDLLLEGLIGELLEKAPLDTLARRRRSVGVDKPALKANKKWKRFHARFTDAPQSDDLAKSLSEVLAGTQSTVSPTERTARGPRQTQAYKRQQRRIRKKEKRSEQRNLKKMKHPLREARRQRAKRGDFLKARRPVHPHRRVHQRLLNRMSAKLASRKTKRSSLAEAVNEPPSFGTGSDEQDELHQRSDFPLGDVHLVISKGGNGDGEVEYVPADEDDVDVVNRKQTWSVARHRPAVRRRISVNQRDFFRFAPVWDRARMEDEGELSDCGRRRTLRRGSTEPEARETKRIDRFMSIRREQSEERKAQEAEPDKPAAASSREAFTIAKTKASSFESQENHRPQKSLQEAEKTPEEPQTDSAESNEQVTDRVTLSPVVTSQEEIQLYTPAPRTSEEQHNIPRLEPIWSLESPESSADVTELMHNRYKRAFNPSASAEHPSSVESQEVQRLEDFFRTNAKLQQKFAEMFDLLLEAIEELDAEENDAREVSDDDGDNEENAGTDADKSFLKRSKRNVLLHPQSWESRERSNMIHRRERSDEDSYENHIIPAQQAPAKPFDGGLLHADSVQPSHDSQQQPESEHGSDEGKPGAFMLRSVVHFMRRASTEFHQLFSSWFGKTA